LLGLFLLFIFIGIGIFSNSDDPFAAIVNAGLTLSAGAGKLCAFYAVFCLQLCTSLDVLAFWHVLGECCISDHSYVLQVSISATKTAIQKAVILYMTKLSPNFSLF
jgi:hypothetical protein